MRTRPLVFVLLAGCTGVKPTASTSDTSDTGGLSLEEFLREKQEKYCEVQELCNPAIACDPEATDAGTETLSCTQVAPEKAAACLEGEWACNDTFPGFEYPIAPEACDEVCSE